jgi:hypothetical protein
MEIARDGMFVHFVPAHMPRLSGARAKPADVFGHRRAASDEHGAGLTDCFSRTLEAKMATYAIDGIRINPASDRVTHVR